MENLVNEAAILAARRDKKVVEMSEFQEAMEKVIAGPERKSRGVTEKEKEIVAYHEACSRAGGSYDSRCGSGAKGQHHQ